MGIDIGIKAENFFISTLNAKGIPFEWIDEWYDFLVNKSIKVEIKSCQISIKDRANKHHRYRIGRFDFTSEDNREKQFHENIWVCFIVRHRDQFLLLGFVRAEELKKKRYVTIHSTRELNLLDLDEWIQQIN